MALLSGCGAEDSVPAVESSAASGAVLGSAGSPPSATCAAGQTGRDGTSAGSRAEGGKGGRGGAAGTDASRAAKATRPAESITASGSEDRADVIDRRTLATKIKELAGDNEGPYVRPKRDTGFSALAIPPGAPMSVWWRGNVPKDVMKLIKSGRRHFRVEIHPAQRSWAEVKNATRCLMPYANGPGVSRLLTNANISITSLKFPPDGSTIQLTYEALDETAPGPSPETVVKVVAAVSGIPEVEATEDGSAPL